MWISTESSLVKPQLYFPGAPPSSASTQTKPTTCHNPLLPQRSLTTTATMSSDSVKQAVIKQILAESNMANARQLIEVRPTRSLSTRLPLSRFRTDFDYVRRK
jgi:hypothetical protein